MNEEEDRTWGQREEGDELEKKQSQFEMKITALTSFGPVVL